MACVGQAQDLCTQCDVTLHACISIRVGTPLSGVLPTGEEGGGKEGGGKESGGKEGGGTCQT